MILSEVNVIDIQKACLCRSVKRDCGQQPEDEVKVHTQCFVDGDSVWIVSPHTHISGCFNGKKF